MATAWSPEVSRTRRVQHDSPLGRWELMIGEPDLGLRPYVTEYQGYVETRAPRPVRRREVPWPGVVLIINFGPPFRITDPRAPLTPSYQSFVAGLYDSYVFTEAIGLSYCLQVNLTPTGAHLCFGIPMHQIANRVVSLDDLLGGDTPSLVEQLHECPSWEARFALVDSFLMRRISRAQSPSPHITWAWQQLQRSRPDGRIGFLAQELGWSSKRLIARFREEIGLPPKALARIIRFHRVVGWLDQEEQIHWAELANRAGYYDQAHFNRDFRELAGSAPGEFLSHRLVDGGNIED
jgi:AraC-like DNA-binding protein